MAHGTYGTCYNADDGFLPMRQKPILTLQMRFRKVAILTSYPSDLNDSIDPVTHKSIRPGALRRYFFVFIVLVCKCFFPFSLCELPPTRSPHDVRHAV